MHRYFVLFSLFLLASCAGGKHDLTSGATHSMSPMPDYLVARDVPPELVALERAGEIAAAEQWIDAQLQNGGSPSDPLAVERERLRRLRSDYNLSPADLLQQMKKDIPDVTAGDIESWRQAGKIQWVEMDGAIHFFRKEPRNLYRVSDDARARRDEALAQKPSAPEGDPNAKKTSKFDLHEEVLKAIKVSEATGTVHPMPITIHARHTITVNAGAVPEGKTIRCWIPFPHEYERQHDVQLLESSPAKAFIAPDSTAQRTVYLEAPAGDASTPTVFWIDYVYRTSAYIPNIDPAKVEQGTDGVAPVYTSAQPPHVDITPEVRALVAQIVGDETNPYLKVDKIFRWLDANIRYVSEMEYSTITSISDKALTERKGDCGVYALTFITLCRAAGVPARWQSGWAMRPGNENMHDWAEFYVAPYGWLPADPSFGLRNHPDPRVHNFYIGHIDPFRLIANLDFATPFTPEKKFWRSDNIDNQRGEVEWDGGNLFYGQWDYDMQVEYKYD